MAFRHGVPLFSYLNRLQKVVYNGRCHFAILSENAFHFRTHRQWFRRIQRVFVQKGNPWKWMKWFVASYGHLHFSSLTSAASPLAVVICCHVFSPVCARICPLHALAALVALAALACYAWGGCTRAHCLLLRSRGRRRSRWERRHRQTLELPSKALCADAV